MQEYMDMQKNKILKLKSELKSKEKQLKELDVKN